MANHYECGFDAKAIKEIAETYGFCLVKGFYSSAEMDEAETRMQTASRLNGGEFPDLLSCDSLRHVMLDERVLAIAHELLGDDLVYYRETAVAFEETPGAITNYPFRELHCDAKGMADTLLEYWNGAPNEIYPAYRFAIYFRDYRDFSGGLKVGPGTHKKNCHYYLQYSTAEGVKSLTRVPHWVEGRVLKLPVAPFELHNVCSERGDLVIFNLRTSHSAGAVRLKGRPNLSLLPLIEETILRDCPDLCLPPPTGSRNAIFFDYGAPTEALDYYIKWRALHSPDDRKLPSRLSMDSNSSFSIRNDAVLVVMAISIANAVKQFRNQADSSGESQVNELLQSRLAQQFAELCLSYAEFTNRHSLFDVHAFRGAYISSPAQAVLTAAQSMRTAALGYKEAHAQQKQLRLNANTT